MGEMLAALFRMEVPRLDLLLALGVKIEEEKLGWTRLHDTLKQELTCCCRRLAHWLWIGFPQPSFSPFLYLPVVSKETLSVWEIHGNSGELLYSRKGRHFPLNLKFHIILLRHSVIKQLVCGFIKHTGSHHLFYFGQGAAVGRICCVFVSGFSYEQKFIGKWQVT